EATAIGCTAEQMSWTKPGSVSSADLAPPPIVAERSYAVTAYPARASTIAALRPLGPDPTTVARSPAMVHRVHQESPELLRRAVSPVEIQPLLNSRAFQTHYRAGSRRTRIDVARRLVLHSGVQKEPAGNQGL